jgi:phosphatidylglycerophosphate synthase
MVRDPAELGQAVSEMDISPTERVLIARADHIVDQKTLSAFVQATETVIDRNAIYALSSDGTRTDAIYSADRDRLLPIVHAVWSPALYESDVLDTAEKLSANPGLPYIVRGEHAAIKIAENRLTAALSSATEHRDGFMARHADRYLSRLISRRLARTAIRPNDVTLFNVAIGLTGAFLLSRGGYWSQLSGTLLFLLCVVLDGVDGELARLKLQETVFGHYLDIVTDNIVHVAIFIGLAVGLYHHTGNRVYLDVLWVLLGGFAFCAVAVYRVTREGADGPRSKTVESLTGVLANRDFAYLLVALAIISRLNWFLIGTAVGSYLFAAILLALNLRGRKPPVRR